MTITLETELTNRGFNIGPNGDLISVSLTTFQNQFSLGFFSGETTADMGMDVSVKRPDGTVTYQKYITAEDKDWVEIAGQGNAQTALNKVMQKAVGETFSDSAFIDALKKPVAEKSAAAADDLKPASQ